MLKSIKQQYIDLREGNMSQANFMRNVRMTLPHLVTNITSFNDTVKILKNKGILSEAIYDRDITSSYGVAGHVNPKSNDDAYSRFVRISILQQKSDQELQKLLSDKGLEDFWTGDKESTFLNLPTDVLKDLTRLSEAKKVKLTADQVNNNELRMGIKVEMEHTNDEAKAKKIALDHLTENPFYYTQLKLSGVDTKVLPSREKKAIAKKKNETELVDKANQMKPVKGFEKAKAVSNKAKKETNTPVKGISLMSLIAKSIYGMKKMNPTGEKMKVVKENNDSRELSKKIAGLGINAEKWNIMSYNEKLYAIDNNRFIPKPMRLQAVKMDWNELTNNFDGVRQGFAFPTEPKSIKPGIGDAIQKKLTKEDLIKMIREELKETFDGRDNMTDVAGHQLDEESKVNTTDIFNIHLLNGDIIKGVKFTDTTHYYLANDPKKVEKEKPTNARVELANKK